MAQNRYMGIDYGDARLGIALSDPLYIAAHPLITLKNDEHLFDNLDDIFCDYNFAGIVIGYPRNMDGSEGFATKKVRAFIEKLTRFIDIPIIEVDERLTTVQASRQLHEQGISARKQKNKVDMTAAALILQSYLDKK